MAEPEKESYLYWETRKRMMAYLAIAGIGRRRRRWLYTTVCHVVNSGARLITEVKQCRAR
jgi:hypothetical protein